MGNFIFSPLLSVPGEIYAPWDESGRQVGIVTLRLCHKEIHVKWTFFYQKRNSLLLQKDDSSKRISQMKKRSKVLKNSDRSLKLRYGIERVLSQIRYQIFCHGWLGTIRKLFKCGNLIKLFELILKK